MMRLKAGFIVCAAVVCVHHAYAVAYAADAAKKEAAPAQIAASDAMRADIDRQLKSGQTDKAMVALEDVIASNGYGDLKEWATQQLFIKAEQTGKVEQVLESLKKRALKAPNNSPLQWAVAEGYARLREWPALSSHYEAMLQKSPDDEAIKSRLMDAYILSGAADKTVVMLEPIVEKNPGDIAHSDMLMNAYVKAGMKDKALALFKKRVQAAPGSPGLRGRYAQALQDFGLLKESLKEWQEAVKIDPSNGIFQRKVNEVTALINGGNQQ